MMSPPIDAMALAQTKQDAANLAVDIADQIAAQSIDFAQNTISFGEADEAHVLALTAIHAGIAAKAYAVHELTAAIREVAPEIAGAISEAGTDIGAGLVEWLEKVCKGQTCQRGT